MITSEQKFKGFSPETLSFLNNLEANNNKEWFEVHKVEYRTYLLEPLQNLCTDLSKGMLKIDSGLIVGARAVSRIYRDTRFSGNKAPYKTAMWLTFKRPSKEWMDAPAYFFEITASAYRYGMGFYSASPDTMRRFREAIDDKPKEFQKAISFYSKQKTFVVEGEKYKKILGEAKPKEIQKWYQMKSFYLVCNRKIDKRLFSEKLADDLLSGFNLLVPLYWYCLSLKSRNRDLP